VFSFPPEDIDAHGGGGIIGWLWYTHCTLIQQTMCSAEEMAVYMDS